MKNFQDFGAKGSAMVKFLNADQKVKLNGVRWLTQSDLDKLRDQVNAWLKARYCGKVNEGG